MALHTIVIDVPELFHADDVEKAVTEHIEALRLVRGSAVNFEVVEYHREKITADLDEDAEYEPTEVEIDFPERP